MLVKRPPPTSTVALLICAFCSWSLSRVLYYIDLHYILFYAWITSSSSTIYYFFQIALSYCICRPAAGEAILGNWHLQWYRYVAPAQSAFYWLSCIYYLLVVIIFNIVWISSSVSNILRTPKINPFIYPAARSSSSGSDRNTAWATEEQALVRV